MTSCQPSCKAHQHRAFGCLCCLAHKARGEQLQLQHAPLFNSIMHHLSSFLAVLPNLVCALCHVQPFDTERHSLRNGGQPSLK